MLGDEQTLDTVKHPLESKSWYCLCGIKQKI